MDDQKKKGIEIETRNKEGISDGNNSEGGVPIRERFVCKFKILIDRILSSKLYTNLHAKAVLGAAFIGVTIVNILEHIPGECWEHIWDTEQIPQHMEGKSIFDRFRSDEREQ